MKGINATSKAKCKSYGRELGEEKITSSKGFSEVFLEKVASKMDATIHLRWLRGRRRA